jgi:hypothetical protein
MAAALGHGSCGGGASLAFHHQADVYNTDTLLQDLGRWTDSLAGQGRFSAVVPVE